MYIEKQHHSATYWHFTVLHQKHLAGVEFSKCSCCPEGMIP